MLGIQSDKRRTYRLLMMNEKHKFVFLYKQQKTSVPQVANR